MINNNPTIVKPETYRSRFMNNVYQYIAAVYRFLLCFHCLVARYHF